MSGIYKFSDRVNTDWRWVLCLLRMSTVTNGNRRIVGWSVVKVCGGGGG